MGRKQGTLVQPAVALACVASAAPWSTCKKSTSQVRGPGRRGSRKAREVEWRTAPGALLRPRAPDLALVPTLQSRGPGAGLWGAPFTAPSTRPPAPSRRTPYPPSPYTPPSCCRSAMQHVPWRRVHRAPRVRVSGHRARAFTASPHAMAAHIPPCTSVCRSVEFLLARAAEKTNSHAAEKYRIKGEASRFAQLFGRRQQELLSCWLRAHFGRLIAASPAFCPSCSTQTTTRNF